MHHRVLLAFEGQGCRIATTPDDENEHCSSSIMEGGDRTASCLLVDRQATELIRQELRGIVWRAMARATISWGAGSTSLGDSVPSLDVFLDGSGSPFESISSESVDDQTRLAGRALLLDPDGGLHHAVKIGVGEVGAWCSAVRVSLPSVLPELLDGVFPEGGAACAAEYIVWIAAGRRGICQVYKPFRIYADEPAPAPEPPLAHGKLESPLQAAGGAGEIGPVW
jgi:hypothetical protein